MPNPNRFVRLLRHCLALGRSAAKRFPVETMDRIEERVTLSERRHGAEIRIAIETALPPLAILAGQTPRERALEVFGGLRVWDTERNNGVLAQAAAMGCSVPEPFMFLSFITLAAIPAFAVTDKGYVNCLTQQLMDPVLSWK